MKKHNSNANGKKGLSNYIGKKHILHNAYALREKHNIDLLNNYGNNHYTFFKKLTNYS